MRVKKPVRPPGPWPQGQRWHRTKSPVTTCPQLGLLHHPCQAGSGYHGSWRRTLPFVVAAFAGSSRSSCGCKDCRALGAGVGDYAGPQPALCPLTTVSCDSPSRATPSTGSPGQGWAVGKPQLHPNPLRRLLPHWPPLPLPLPLPAGPQVPEGLTVPAGTPWMEGADLGEEVLGSLNPSTSSLKSTIIIPSSPNHTQPNGPQGPATPLTLLPRE